jgi:hypothetical protein
MGAHIHTASPVGAYLVRTWAKFACSAGTQQGVAGGGVDVKGGGVVAAQDVDAHSVMSILSCYSGVRKLRWAEENKEPQVRSIIHRAVAQPVRAADS